MTEKKIEELNPNHETVMGCLRLALMDLNNPTYSDKEKISGKMQVKPYPIQEKTFRNFRDDFKYVCG